MRNIDHSESRIVRKQAALYHVHDVKRNICEPCSQISTPFQALHQTRECPSFHMSDPTLEDSTTALMPLPPGYAPPQPILEHPGPRPGTRGYDPHRAINAFPPDAEAEFKSLLEHSPGRRRKTIAEVRDGISWFTDPTRSCVTSSDQNARHWWKSTFRYCPLQDCLFAKPSAKHTLERKVVTEENYFQTILYEHDINGPRGHEATSKALLQRYYG